MNGKRWTKGKKELKVDNTAQADKNGQPSRQTEDIRTNKIDGQKTDIKDKQNRLQMGREGEINGWKKRDKKKGREDNKDLRPDKRTQKIKQTKKHGWTDRQTDLRKVHIKP